MKALITGATRGIGRAICEHLAAKAYDLTIISRNEKDLQNLATDLVEIGAGEVNYFAADLSSSADRQELITSLDQDFNLLVNNVGLYDMTVTSEIFSGKMHEQLSINFYPALDITNALIPSIKSKNGMIVFIGSVAAKTLIKEAAAYSLSKSILSNYVELLQKEHKGTGLKVAEIIPGPVNTSSWDGIEAPKEEFVQTRDVVEAFNTIISTNKNINIDRIEISSVKH